MADVERLFRGRVVGFGTSVDRAGTADVDVVGGETGFSGLGVLLP
jgi:hypothetical protein